MQSKKNVIISALLVISMCVTLIVGGTYAWFTGKVGTNVNKIATGTLEVSLKMRNNSADEWTDANNQTMNFLRMGEDGLVDDSATNPVMWEPGATFYLPMLQVTNEGTLALKYRIVLTGAQGDVKLLEAIAFDAQLYDAEGNLTKTVRNAYGAETICDGILLPAASSDTLILSATMDENAGNEYQGLTVENLAVTVYAVQASYEKDSFGDDYDDGLEFPVVASRNVTVDSSNLTSEEVTVASDAKVEGTTTSFAKATVPAGVKLKEGKSELTLNVVPTKTSSNFTVAEGSVAKSYDISVDEVAEDNTGKITVELYVGTGLLDVTVYHKEVAMAAEDYSYDAATGIVTIKTATFSPFTVVGKAGAIVDGKAYNDLQTAVNAATDGAVVTMGADYTGDLLINGKNITFNFAGNVIHGRLYIGCVYEGGFYKNAETSKVTFKDTVGNGGVTSTENTTVMAKNGSELVIDGGNFVNEYAKGSSGYSKVILMTNCNLTVNGGYIHNNAQVGSYNRVIDVDNDGKSAKVVINGGKIEGASVGGYSYLISSDTSGDVFDVEINDGEFLSHGSYGYLTQTYGNVLVKTCTFVSEKHNQVFGNYTGSTVTVKGGTYTINEGSSAHLAGLMYCNKENGYGYTKGQLVLDPTTEIRINTNSYSGMLTDCGCKEVKGTDGYYTITKA